MIITMTENQQQEPLLLTCLHERHVALGAKMSPFAGFDMPIQYGSIITEHLAVRQKAGIFDVSHMGEIFVEGKDAERFVNHTGSSSRTITYWSSMRPILTRILPGSRSR